MKDEPAYRYWSSVIDGLSLELKEMLLKLLQEDLDKEKWRQTYRARFVNMTMKLPPGELLETLKKDGFTISREGEML